MKRLTAYAMVLMLARSLLGATEYFVRVDGNDANDGLSWATARADIQSALDLAGDGDTVTVSNGTYLVDYPAPSYALVLTNDVTVRSVNGPAVTIIDAGSVNERRVARVTADQAILNGFTLKRGYNHSWYDDGGPGGLVLEAGMVTNCIITANRSYRRGGGVYVNGGTLVGSVVQGNYCGSEGPGGVQIDSGAVLYCAISNNTTAWNGKSGGGIFVTGGTVSNSLITGNTVGISGVTGARGGGVYQTGGLVVSSEITNNVSHTFGGGVYLAGGILRNALLSRNGSDVEGGGLYLTDGVVENCTVVVNDTVLGGGDGIWMSGGSVSNSIAYLNFGSNLDRNGGSVAYSCINPLPAGEGNKANDPLFVDDPNGDYHLSIFSPCADAGTNRPWMKGGADLDGAARIVNAIVDMGAYERDLSPGGPLQCQMTADTVSGSGSLEVTLTALLAGDHTNNVTYTWDFGDGEGASGTDQGVVTHTFGPGYFTVTLTVENTIPETHSVSRTDYIKVAPDTCYVSKNGLNIAPYESWERAAASVDDAVAIGSSAVLISNGTYNVADNGIVVNRDMTIRGINGPEVTILDAQYVNERRILWVDAPGARIEGITARRGKWYSKTDGGNGIKLTQGLVTNCIIENGAGYVFGAIWVQGGLVTDCIIRNNVGSSDASEGGGVYVQDGLVENCVISNNTANYSSGRTGGGVRLAGGAMRGCLVVDNRADHATSGSGGGVHISAGELQNCTITGNRATTQAGGVLAEGGATCINNIVVGNSAGVAKDIDGAATFGYSCSPDLADGVNGNIVDDPKFVNASAGDFSLQEESPCVNRGVPLAWMSGALDLAGNPRIAGSKPDMGAYELVSPFGTLFLIR